MNMAVRGLALLAAFVVVGMAAGCGGGGGGSHSSGAVVQSPFMGQWAGSWTDSDGNRGAIDTTVAAGGQMTVGLTETTQGLTGAGSGTVAPAGTFSFNYSFDGGATLNGSGTFVANGSNGLTGTMVIKQNGQTQGSANFTLTKQ